MAKILYSMAQDGRGHASRGYEIIRRLAKQGHKIMVLTGGDTYEPLENAMQGMKNVSLRRLPGLRFAYNKKGEVDYAKTAASNFETILAGDVIVKKLKKLIDEYGFDFAITDFEPFLPRAAKSKKLSFITFDNQHKIIFGKKIAKKMKIKHIPSYLVTSQVVRSFHPLGRKCIIASVFKPELRKKKVGKTEIIVVGPLIRREVEELRKKVVKKDFVLVYVKPVLEKVIIPKLRSIKEHKFIMYVHDPEKKKKSKNIVYKKHSAQKFAEDLARCKAVVASAGELLMAEAIYLGKPIFLMPEGGTFEQTLNGYSVKEAGIGDYEEITKVKKEDINHFLSNINKYEHKLRKIRITNGIRTVMHIINSELAKAMQKKPGCRKE
ncbi:hypothetical protein JW756_05385 [Candidatus Woesearchaeota archaeon]|nr:hypothetical protein [Candidatus Woesearchaeota archaeon]